MAKRSHPPAKPKLKPKAKPKLKSKAGPVTNLPAIVAIGASAGGLEAFSELLRALPRELPNSPGLALVLLQHLQSGHASILPQLLQKTTPLPVEEARDGVVPQAGNVYVLPAGKVMTLEKGRLRLRARGQREVGTVIDVFMQSLAAERKSGAIGVVLAGTASDGTHGLQAIKAEGGICFAQSEGSTEFSSMARHAVASGAVDFVLAPSEIARELARMGRSSYVAPMPDQPSATAPGLAPGRSRTYGAIVDLMRRDTGMDFSEYRPSTISRRIARRMALHNVEQPEEYLRYLRAHPGEVAQLGEDILIPATRFFREPKVFETLKQKVLIPLVRQRKQAGQPIRLWSVGCSTGEEAYTLAIIALESLGGQGGGGATVQVFGTDLNESAVRRARQGLYGADIASEMTPERLQRFFVKTERGYRVSRALREACIFARHNVTREAPFSRLDVILCRNVMIYMEPTLQRRLLPVLHYALNAGGTLVLGSAESAGAAPKLFKPLSRVNRKLKIYSKVGSGAPVHFPLVEPAGAEHHPRPQPPPARGEDAHQEADRVLLDQFSPPGVIVDANLDVVEFRGRTSDFLEPAPGAASLNLLKMARGDIGAYVRSAVLQARRTGAMVKLDDISTSAGEGREAGREAAITVVPLEVQGAAAQALFLVLFHAAAARGKRERGKEPAHAGQELERARRSLAASRRLLATLSDEHQASKQEYQAANEEIASANEELQSTNEELETSKEELQSANEELNTVNEELRHSNAEQHQLSEDLQNLISAVDIAIVLLDRELRVRRYSPAAERVLRLMPTDVGRRIGEVRWGLPMPDLEQLVLTTLARGISQTRELQDGEGHWYELRLHPALGVEQKVEGVVAVLADIEAAKRLEERQRAAVDLAETVADAAHNPVALLDKSLKLVRGNAGFRSYWNDGKAPRGWDAEALRRAIDKAGDGGVAELTMDLNGRRVNLRARRLRDTGRGTLYLVSGD